VSETQQEEQRRFSRVHFDAEVIIAKDEQRWETTLHDISLNGVLVDAPKEGEVSIGENFSLEVLFTEGGSLITCEAVVAHINDAGIGFKINNIDIESVAHLRRLMELNLGDPELMDRELTALHWR